MVRQKGQMHMLLLLFHRTVHDAGCRWCTSMLVLQVLPKYSPCTNLGSTPIQQEHERLKLGMPKPDICVPEKKNT
jgi:hypothetical protein